MVDCDRNEDLKRCVKSRQKGMIMRHKRATKAMVSMTDMSEFAISDLRRSPYLSRFLLYDWIFVTNRPFDLIVDVHHYNILSLALILHRTKNHRMPRRPVLQVFKKISSYVLCPFVRLYWINFLLAANIEYLHLLEVCCIIHPISVEVRGR
jgi:hypothetical protein